jgi:hypothetical protein
MAKQTKSNSTPRVSEYDYYTLSRKKDSYSTLKSKYAQLQKRVWGEASIVVGYYFIAHLESIESPIKTREQAIATAYWKQEESDYFNTEVIAEFLLGALYNKHSYGPVINMNSLLGKTIYVRKVERYDDLDGKFRYSILWELAPEVTYTPDDVLADAFYISEEEQDIAYDDKSDSELLESYSSLGELTDNDEE